MAGDRDCFDSLPAEVDVSIHARAWRATAALASNCLRALFQSTPAHGGRLATTSRIVSPMASFNPRPRMAGDSFGLASQSRQVCFNPRPRMAGDQSGSRRAHGNHDVSIHARAWRATFVLAPHHCRPCFNPRPRMAGDPHSPAYDLGRYCFNPRPRMAGDNSDRFARPQHGSFNPRPRMAGDETKNRHGAVLGVSIHARAWRATRIATELCCMRQRFNPRPRMAGDTSTGPCGAVPGGFNPRSRMAGDIRVCAVGDRQLVSIHARAWRATIEQWAQELRRQVSIHARAWRATGHLLMPQASHSVSSHARAWRATAPALLSARRA